MDFNGLSLEQAPPISVPLRFFLVAPIFALFAGIFLLFGDSAALMSRYSVDAIVVTHLVTIGFFSFIMIGALTQMLPVLASANIPKVKMVASLSFFSLVFGVIFMVVGFETADFQLLFGASLLLGIGFFIVIFSMFYAMKSVVHFTASIKGMFVSLFFALMIVLLGIYLLYGYAQNNITEGHYVVADIHSVWAIFGFCGVLIIGVSFQVLPMFYVAPQFKQFFEKKVVLLIIAALFVWMYLTLFPQKYLLFAKLWIVTFFLAFAVAVWMKFNKRKRPLFDVTVLYWRSGALFLFFGSLLWIVDDFYNHRYIVLVALFIGGGFIFSVILGMLYKIIPFLVWFHLNGLGYMTIPTMNEMINKKLAYLQFFSFLFSIVGFMVTLFIPVFLVPSALLFIVTMALLEYNIFIPVLIFIKTKKRKPDFDMSQFAT